MLETKLCSRNLIKRKTTRVAPLERYSVLFFKWTKEELQQMDQRTRKLRTMHKFLHIRRQTNYKCQQWKKKKSYKNWYAIKQRNQTCFVCIARYLLTHLFFANFFWFVSSSRIVWFVSSFVSVRSSQHIFAYFFPFIDIFSCFRNFFTNPSNLIFHPGFVFLFWAPRISIFTNPSARAEYDTKSISKRSLTGLNSEFSFSQTSCLTKAEEYSLSNYLSIAGGRIIGFIPFPRVLVLFEMQLAWSRIWTHVVVSISYNDNHYTTGPPNGPLRYRQICHSFIN